MAVRCPVPYCASELVFETVGDITGMGRSVLPRCPQCERRARAEHVSRLAGHDPYPNVPEPVANGRLCRMCQTPLKGLQRVYCANAKCRRDGKADWQSHYYERSKDGGVTV